MLLSSISVLDKVNPIDPADMPGGWGATYDPAPYEDPPEEPSFITDVTEPPVLCEAASTSGQNTVSWCKPPIKYPPEKRCPLGRPLFPMQLRDPGMWTVPPSYTDDSSNKVNIQPVNKKARMNFYVNVAIILVLLLIMLKIMY